MNVYGLDWLGGRLAASEVAGTGSFDRNLCGLPDKKIMVRREK